MLFCSGEQLTVHIQNGKKSLKGKKERKRGVGVGVHALRLRHGASASW